MSEAAKWQRADRGGGRICEVCKQAIGRRTPAMRRDEETNDFRGDDRVTFRHLHCHQTRALSDKVWNERGGPALQAEVVRLREALEKWSADMHGPSTRPCETCERATKAMGAPMGCYAWQVIMSRSRAALSPAKETTT